MIRMEKIAFILTLMPLLCQRSCNPRFLCRVRKWACFKRNFWAKGLLNGVVKWRKAKTNTNILTILAHIIKLLLILLFHVKAKQMLYFKTIPFPDNVKQPEIELALRKHALKRTSSLDFQSSTMNIGIDKIFFGHQRKIYFVPYIKIKF